MGIREHIETAIQIAGSETKLGKATGYTQHAIWRAKTRGTVTPKMALAIHRALSGKVPASLLCPDMWPTPKHVPEGGPSNRRASRAA